MMRRRLKRDKRYGLLKFSFFLYTLLGVFALIWLRTAVVNLEYELSQMEKQKVGLIREGKLISAEKAYLYSAREVEGVAIKQFAMSLPKRENIFFVKKINEAAPYKASISSVP